MKMRNLYSQDLRKVDMMSNNTHVVCKQIDRLARIESSLETIKNLQNMLLKVVVTVTSGILIEFFSILILYLINRK